MHNPFVTVICPNFNGGQFVLKTIGSFLSLDYPHDSFEVIIVDNNSTDGTKTLIKDHFRQELDAGRLKLIECERNLGAPAAYNIAIRNAHLVYEYILKLDNDIILHKDALRHMLSGIKDDHNFAIAGGKVYYYQDRTRIHLIGSCIHPIFCGGIGIGKFVYDRGQYDRDLTLDAVNGCMMLIKRGVFEKIGLMNENYFLYFEDLDLSIRAKRCGFKQRYCHKAKAYHNTTLPGKRFCSHRWLRFAILNSFLFTKNNYFRFRDYLLFFIGIHIKILRYDIGIMMNNPICAWFTFLPTVFKAYRDGIILMVRGK